MNGEDNWKAAMDQFVAKQVRITSFKGQDASGCDVVRAEMDRNRFMWRVVNLCVPSL